MPVRLPTYAALGSNRDGHELRCLLRRPPPERLLQRLQALPEPGNDEEHGKCRELHGSWVEEDWYAGMCIRHDFGRSGSFETPTQENAKLPRSMVQAVSMTSSCPALPCQRHASATPAPPPPEPLALSSGRAVAGAWLQVVLFTLLAWAAVMCTGLGGNLGAVSRTLANKLAATGAMTQDRVGGHPP